MSTNNPLPDAHDTKFDRQMRLWGGHGQHKLETARLCIIGSSGLASETLKNLVLPNVGAYDMIDSALVQLCDCGANFFLEENQVGKSRCESVVAALQEMNPEVKGKAIHLTNNQPHSAANQQQLINDYIDKNLESFKQYSCVILCNQPITSSLMTLCSSLYDANLPVCIARVHGQIGLVRLIKREHLIVESHPTNDRRDLFIHPKQFEHWTEYREFLQSFRFVAQPTTAPVTDDTTPIAVEDDGPVTHSDDSLTLSQPTLNASSTLNGDGRDSELHAHIPYVAILYEALQRRSKATKQTVPLTYDEQQAFKQSIKELSWDFGNETNFNEAYDAASRAYHLPTLDSATQSVYKDSKAQAIQQLLQQSSSSTAQQIDVDPFWLCVAAVNEFVATEGHGVNLPVSIDLPDMHSKTEWYVKLKQIFKSKSDADLNAVIQHVRKIEQVIQQSQSIKPVSDTYISYFVKNCRALRVVRTRSVAEEYGLHSANDSVEQSNNHFTGTINEFLEEFAFESSDNASEQGDLPFVIPRPAIVHWYLSLRACDLFYEKHGRYPGLLTSEEEASSDMETDAVKQWETDAKELAELCTELMTSQNLACSTDVDVCMEMARAGACEPHVIAAYVGGVASQEVLKVLLQQYVPVNNTHIFNGIHGEAKTFNF